MLAHRQVSWGHVPGAATLSSLLSTLPFRFDFTGALLLLTANVQCALVPGVPGVPATQGASGERSGRDAQMSGGVALRSSLFGKGI